MSDGNAVHWCLLGIGWTHLLVAAMQVCTQQIATCQNVSSQGVLRVKPLLSCSKAEGPDATHKFGFCVQRELLKELPDPVRTSALLVVEDAKAKSDPQTVATLIGES